MPLRDLPVALLGITRRIAPADSLPVLENRGEEKRRLLTTCDETEFVIQLAIIMY